MASCITAKVSVLQSNRQSGAQTPERVTVIVQKPPSKEDAKPQPGDGKPLLADAPADIPVPASAFAMLKSGVTSAKSEADMSPFSSAPLPPKEPSEETAGTESDEQVNNQVLHLPLRSTANSTLLSIVCVNERFRAAVLSHSHQIWMFIHSSSHSL